MELRQLCYFVAVVDAGSFSSAVPALGIPQSTVEAERQLK